MGVSLEKRMRILETKLARLRRNNEQSRGSVEQMNNDTTDSLGQLEELTQEAERIEQQAEAAGDHRTALAAIRELCRIVELSAKLRGDLDERSPTNILNVNLDYETGKRIAETYLARRRELEAE
jgi:hypothetical protein